MKRKASELVDKESRLSELLFNKSQKLVDKLDPKDDDQVSDQKPAWIDEDDNIFGANIIPNNSSKSLYSEKLKQKYETLMGTPSWAKLNREIKPEDEEKEEILRTVGHLHRKNTNCLPKDYLEMKRLGQINHTTRNEGRVITCVEFHPKISVAMVGGKSGVVSLFSVGGDTSNKLHSFKLKQWHVTAAQFTPDGSEALIASKINHKYCVYDLAKAEPKLVQLPHIIKTPTIFRLSNDGKYIATSDGFENVHLISAASKELLKTFTHNGKVASVAFSHDSTSMYSYGTQGEITVWDLSMLRPVKKFYDHGCVSASCLTTSACGKLLATGSGEGIVNIYQIENLTTSEPMPHKVISNLTTKITNLNFNATTEILAMSSSYYPNAVKLVHIPSFHIFANFPVPSLNLYQVDTVSFSPNSGYMALGNNKGCANLYRLKYYDNY